jgi:aspartyl-tRNA(Asn)/glutamyl-tRNA(Gln) amidotransferase subunit C
VRLQLIFQPCHFPPTDISRIANLARLELSLPESERMLTQLNNFFDIVQKMRAVDTTGIEPLAHPVATIVTSPCACATTWSANRTSARPTSAARRRSKTGLFLVPKVIE